jgi:hypothetical protein
MALPTFCKADKRPHCFWLPLTILVLLGLLAVFSMPWFPVGSNSCESLEWFGQLGALRGGDSSEPVSEYVRSDGPSLKQILQDCSMEPFSSPIRNEEKYVVVSYLPEQLGKARQHLGEIVAITHSLRRRLVLPRVGSSAIGMGYKLPFCSYFDEKFLGLYIPWVSDDYFWDSIMKNGKYRRRSVSFVGISANSSWCPLGESDILQVTLNKTGSLSGLPLDSICVQEVAWDASQESHEEAQRQLFMELNKRQNADVLVFVKHSYSHVSPGSFRLEGTRRLRQPYRIHDALNLIRARLGPDYIAVQWRMEGASNDKVVCARALVRHVKELSRGHSGLPPAVFFATDLAYDGRLLRSSSFYQVSSNDKAGFEYVMAELHPYMWGAAFPEIEELDSGILSLLDKWVCIEAGVFISGPPGCARGGTYVQGIAEERSLLGKEANVVWQTD